MYPLPYALQRTPGRSIDIIQRTLVTLNVRHDWTTDLLRDRYAISVVIRADCIDGQRSAIRDATFRRCAPRCDLPTAILCQNWKRAWEARSRPVSRERRVTGRTWDARPDSRPFRPARWDPRRAAGIGLYPPAVLQTKRTKAQFWARLRAPDHLGRGANRRERRRARNDVYVQACKYVRAYVRACLPPSMKYFHWFHGQQTRLYDANNTLHSAAVPFTSLPRGRADRARKIQGERGTREEGGGGENERKNESSIARDSPSSCPPRDHIVDDRSTNLAKRHRSRWLQPWRVLTAGILKVYFRAALRSRIRSNADQVGHVTMDLLSWEKGEKVKKKVKRHFFV